MALSKLLKLVMKGSTKAKKVPKKALDVPPGIKEKLDKELSLEENTLQREFLEERTIQGMPMEDIRKGGLPDIAANLPGYSEQPALLRPKRNSELAGFNPNVDKFDNGLSPFVSLDSIKAIRKAGADISPSEVKKYIELQKKYRPGYKKNPDIKREGDRVISVTYEIEDGLTQLEKRQLAKINSKMIEVDKPIKDRAALVRMANQTDQDIFIDAKGMQTLADDGFFDNFNIEDYIKSQMDIRNQAILDLEEIGYVKPTTDFIQRSEPGLMEMPTPANDRKRGGSVIERNPYGSDYQKLI